MLKVLKKLSKYAIVIVLIMTFVSLRPLPGQASLQDLNTQKKNLQDSIAKNESQKKQQQAVLDHLKSEIDALNSNIQSTQNTINSISNHVTEVAKHISDLTNQINQQTDSINQKKAELQDTINHMYIDDSANNPALTFMQSQTISDAVADLQSYQAIELEIENKAKEIEDLKASLEQKRVESEKQQSSLTSLKEQQIQQKKALDSQKGLKQDLSNQTVQSIAQIDSTVNQYKSDLRAVDGKISEFLASIKLQEGYVAASGDFVVVNAQPWHYFQTDARWGSSPLDPSSSDSDSFAESGCLVTSVTMVANRYGISGTPPQILARLRQAGAMYGDLLAWGGVKDAFGGKLDFVAGGKEAFNAHILDTSLAAGNPVIVHISGGSSGHWIVVSSKVGDKYAVEDPYFQSGRVYPAKLIDYMARLQPS